MALEQGCQTQSQNGPLFDPSEEMSSQVRLRLLPRATCLYDEPIQLKVAGLRWKQVVTMRATSTDERGVVFRSSATYRADGGGEVDLNRDPSLSGSYVGVEPMGLLQSLKADTLHKYFYKNKALSPHIVKFSVHDEEKDGILAEETNERFLMGEGVSRVSVKEGNIRGALFTPPGTVGSFPLCQIGGEACQIRVGESRMYRQRNEMGIVAAFCHSDTGEGPFPAVLDLNTFMSEKRACLLANKGFVVLAIAALNDRSGNIKEIHLDHFKEALCVFITFLCVISQVGSKGVGIISRSKGADIALSLAAFVPGVKAVVWINGSSANVGIPLYYKKRQILSPLMLDFSKVIPTESGANLIKHALENPLAEGKTGTLIPIERASARFLFAAAEDDLNWDSKAYMEEMVKRLKRHGKENFESVLYPKAGHLLEPPYGPFCPSALHGMLNFSVVWGGEPKAHAAAEFHLWKKIQEFLTTHLSCGDVQANL
uniref:Acyl-coenzyme A thioesterase 1-like n=1 Tax=Amphilophus citrinellus TaxID=61819 RepID=A0A3Q0S8N2_AMPCI